MLCYVVWRDFSRYRFLSVMLDTCLDSVVEVFEGIDSERIRFATYADENNLMI